MATSLVKTKAFQGNADPCMLYASPEGVQRETLRMLESFPPHRHIANLGHGLNPDTPRESLFAFVETVKAFRYV
jgi:uroporphyrinogen decarboxylase